MHYKYHIIWHGVESGLPQLEAKDLTARTMARYMERTPRAANSGSVDQKVLWESEVIAYFRGAKEHEHFVYLQTSALRSSMILSGTPCFGLLSHPFPSDSQINVLYQFLILSTSATVKFISCPYQYQLKRMKYGVYLALISILLTSLLTLTLSH
jgi:hypothetical protein